MKPFLLILGGSIGVGKTTLAYHLANDIPNIEIIENDTIRRELLGFPLDYFMNHDLDQSFSPENNQRVDNEMDRRTDLFLQQGKHVIRAHVDVSASDIEKYKTQFPIARVIHVYLQAAENIIKSRLQKRKLERDSLSNLSIEQGHASDADENVLLKFPVMTDAPIGWIALDATQSLETLASELKEILLQ